MTEAATARRVLFFAPFGSYTVHHQLDAVVASALRLRGAEVFVIRCDGFFPGCDQFGMVSDVPSVCANCQNCGDSFFAAFRLPTLQLSAAVLESDRVRVEEWINNLTPTEYFTADFLGVPIGKWCASSLLSYYRTTPRAFLDKEIRAKTAETHRAMLVTGLLTYISVSRIIEQVKPSHMFCFNARYAPYRVAFEAARERGVEVITHERGHADDSFTVFSNYGSIQTRPVFDGYERWKDVPLSRDELMRVKTYFSNREQGTDSNFEPFIDFATEYSSVRGLLRIPAQARIVGVFTSSEYEFKLCPDYDSFTEQLDFIERLMVVFRERPDDYLVVRHHPYIGGNASSAQATADHGFIERAYQLARQAPPNVRFIMPGERINTYALIHNIDAAIAFLSTAGVEAVARGVATASFSESAYKDALTATIEDDGKRYLHGLIDGLMDATQNLRIDDMRKLYRFQRMLISKLSNHFKTFGIKNTYQSDLRIEHFSMLAEGGDEALDRVCSHVMRNTPLLPQPTESQLNASTKDEDAFLEQSLGDIRRLRARVKEESIRQKSLTHAEEIVVLALGSDGQRPGGLERSRHAHVQVVPVNLVAGCTYNELAALIETTSAPFMAISSSVVEYDESFFSHSVDTLLSEEGKDKFGILCGAWIRQGSGRVVDQIFSKRTPRVSLSQLVELCPPLIEEPYRLLSLALVRKEHGLAFLRSMGQAPITSPEALKPMLEWLCGDGFIHSLAHGALLPT
ncbi:MAG: hypothetical protein RL518_2365 [Pseudomonadota bacterium]|jgi:hypothetical protein